MMIGWLHWVGCMAWGTALQELPVFPITIHDLWRSRKMASDVCRKELIACRGRGAHKLVAEIDFHTEADNKARLDEVSRQRDAALADKLGNFKGHPSIDAFLMQFQPQEVARRSRFKCLLFKGPSQCGKSLRAEALYGCDATLVVNCQGLAPHTPSIKRFDRQKHLAIVWDEVDESQVLANKLIFQATNKVTALGQSACNAFAYERYLFGTAMILCSNVFSFTHSRGKPLNDEDRDWLEKNILVAELPAGEKWFEETASCQNA